MKIVSRTPETWHQGYKDGVRDCVVTVLMSIAEIRNVAGMADPLGANYIDLTCDAVIDALMEHIFVDPDQ
jgi:hypothetical protein